MGDHRPQVLFVCVHNAGRSQMAAALLAHHGGDRVVVRSAGTAPAEEINEAVAERLIARRADVGTIVLECTNMPPYRASIEAATGFKTLWLQDCAALFRPFEGA